MCYSKVVEDLNSFVVMLQFQMDHRPETEHILGPPAKASWHYDNMHTLVTGSGSHNVLCSVTLEEGRIWSYFCDISCEKYRFFHKVLLGMKYPVLHLIALAYHAVTGYTLSWLYCQIYSKHACYTTDSFLVESDSDSARGFSLKNIDQSPEVCLVSTSWPFMNEQSFFPALFCSVTYHCALYLKRLMSHSGTITWAAFDQMWLNVYNKSPGNDNYLTQLCNINVGWCQCVKDPAPWETVSVKQSGSADSPLLSPLP